MKKVLTGATALGALTLGFTAHAGCMDPGLAALAGHIAANGPLDAGATSSAHEPF